MIKNQFDYFIHAFTHLNTGGGRIRELAPHKPLLLLSVIGAFQNGLLTDRRVPISPELISIFKTNWNRLVHTGHTLAFAMPFFRLRNEPGNWWQLVANPGCELWVQTGDLSSFNSLSKAVDYAELDAGLTALLLNPDTRSLLEQRLLNCYFPGQNEVNLIHTEIDFIRQSMYEEPVAEYGSKLNRTKKRLNSETYEIELYSREAVFRREVVRLYDDTCCITGVRVAAPYSFSMVDACHIVPFYKTFNNHPTNGIALYPNLHRAFDKGAISIDDNYRVIVSGTFVERNDSLYSLKKLIGTSILLPHDKRYQPDPDAFAWHRKHTFRG